MPAPSNPFVAPHPQELGKERGETVDGRLERERRREFVETQRRVEFLDENLVRQARDDAWTRAVQQQVTAAVGDGAEPSASAIDRIECGTTMCRIEAKHRDGQSERDFLQTLMHLEAFGRVEAFAQRIDLGKGRSSTRTYITRDGHRLPPRHETRVN